MQVETTLNIDEDIKRTLDGAAMAMGLTRSRVIILIMKRLMVRHEACLRFMRTVQYQKRSTSGGWKRIHVTLSAVEYEQCIDMRKLCKRSVSWLVAHGAKTVLEDMLSAFFAGKGDNFTDNYPYNNYIIARDMIGNVICWRIYWGIPSKHQRYFKKRLI